MWGSWAPSEPCSVSCDGQGFQTLARNCSTGNVKDCESLGGHWWQVAACDNGPCIFCKCFTRRIFSLDTFLKFFSSSLCSLMFNVTGQMFVPHDMSYVLICCLPYARTGRLFFSYCICWNKSTIFQVLPVVSPHSKIY